MTASQDQSYNELKDNAEVISSYDLIMQAENVIAAANSGTFIPPPLSNWLMGVIEETGTENETDVNLISNATADKIVDKLKIVSSAIMINL